MSNPQPECNLACQTKIIINGDSVSGLVEATCEGIKHAFDNGAKFTNGSEIIALLNKMEDDALSLQKLVLKGVHYSGPTGKMLE